MLADRVTRTHSDAKSIDVAEVWCDSNQTRKLKCRQRGYEAVIKLHLDRLHLCQQLLQLRLLQVEQQA